MALTVSKVEPDTADGSFVVAFDGAVQSARRELAQTEFVQPVILIDLQRMDVQSLPSAVEAEQASDDSSDASHGAVEHMGDVDGARPIQIGLSSDGAARTVTTAETPGISVVALDVTPENGGPPDVLLVDAGGDGGAVVTTVATEDGGSRTVIISVDAEGAPTDTPLIVVSSNDGADSVTAFGVLGPSQQIAPSRSLLLIIPDTDAASMSIAVTSALRADQIDPATAFRNNGIVTTEGGFTAGRYGGAVEITIDDRKVVLWLDAGRNIGPTETGETTADFGLILDGGEAGGSVSSEVRQIKLGFEQGRLVSISFEDQSVDDLDALVRQLASDGPAPPGGYTFGFSQSGALLNKASELSSALQGEVASISRIALRGVQDEDMQASLIRREPDQASQQPRQS